MVDNSSYYSDDLVVKSASLSGNGTTFTSEMPNSLVEIKTVKWKVYRTSLIDEKEFLCLANQKMWDKIEEIKIKDTCINEFMSSWKISDYIKQKVNNII